MIIVLDGTSDKNSVKLARLRSELGWDIVNNESAAFFLIVNYKKKVITLAVIRKYEKKEPTSKKEI